MEPIIFDEKENFEMSVSFEGVGQVCATFLGGGLTEGHVVKMSAAGTVSACTDGDAFCGVTMCCKDDACTVLVRGFVTVKYTGTAPEVGLKALEADGKGGVKTAETGVSCLVADVDTIDKTVTILL